MNFGISFHRQGGAGQVLPLLVDDVYNPAAESQFPYMGCLNVVSLIKLLFHGI